MYIYISRHLDLYRYVFFYVYVYEYSLGRAFRNFNKPAVCVCEKSCFKCLRSQVYLRVILVLLKHLHALLIT